MARLRNAVSWTKNHRDDFFLLGALVGGICFWISMWSGL